MWKKHKWTIIIAVVIAVALAGSFFLGGAPEKEQLPAPEADTSLSENVPAAEDTQAKPDDTGEEQQPADRDETPEENENTAEPHPSTADDPEAITTTEPSVESTPSPVPEAPVENKCTISICCATILDNMDKLTPGLESIIPADGWILTPVEVTFNEGESVFDVLLRTCQERKIHFEYMDTPMYNSAYIEGIYNIYEFDCGELSGWMYSVNGWFPNYGCSQYTLQNGDTINWVYTCDLGADVGDNSMTSQQ